MRPAAVQPVFAGRGPFRPIGLPPSCSGGQSSSNTPAWLLLQQRPPAVSVAPDSAGEQRAATSDTDPAYDDIYPEEPSTLARGPCNPPPSCSNLNTTYRPYYLRKRDREQAEEFVECKQDAPVSVPSSTAAPPEQPIILQIQAQNQRMKQLLAQKPVQQPPTIKQSSPSIALATQGQVVRQRIPVVANNDKIDHLLARIDQLDQKLNLNLETVQKPSSENPTRSIEIQTDSQPITIAREGQLVTDYNKLFSSTNGAPRDPRDEEIQLLKENQQALISQNKMMQETIKVLQTQFFLQNQLFQEKMEAQNSVPRPPVVPPTQLQTSVGPKRVVQQLSQTHTQPLQSLQQQRSVPTKTKHQEAQEECAYANHKIEDPYALQKKPFVAITRKKNSAPQPAAQQTTNEGPATKDKLAYEPFVVHPQIDPEIEMLNEINNQLSYQIENLFG